MHLTFEQRRVLRRQAPLILLMVLLFLLYLAQVIFKGGWEASLLMVPAPFGEIWSRLTSGAWQAGDIRALATLFTYAFFHGDAEHVFYNLAFLWLFAGLVVEQLGNRWLLPLFLLTAIGGAILHGMLNAGSPIPMLGASGAVLGFQGAYLGLALRWRLPDPHLWPMAHPTPPSTLVVLALIGLSFDFMGVMDHESHGIAYGAHLGGFITGFFITSVLGPRPAEAR